MSHASADGDTNELVNYTNDNVNCDYEYGDADYNGDNYDNYNDGDYANIANDSSPTAAAAVGPISRGPVRHYRERHPMPVYQHAGAARRAAALAAGAADHRRRAARCAAMKGQVLINLSENWPRVFARHKQTLAIQAGRPRKGNSQRALPREEWAGRVLREKLAIEAEAEIAANTVRRT